MPHSFRAISGMRSCARTQAVKKSCRTLAGQFSAAPRRGTGIVNVCLPQSLTIEKQVELFSNVLWLALSCLLLGFWLMGRNRWADASLRSSVTVQLVALALLIVVLLPVVSLTDDLQACTMPAESEHLSRRGDFQTIADFTLHTVSVVIAGLVPFSASPRAETFAWLSLPAETESPSAGYLRILGTRPPPAV
jgi:hypothetical protein